MMGFPGSTLAGKSDKITGVLEGGAALIIVSYASAGSYATTARRLKPDNEGKIIMSYELTTDAIQALIGCSLGAFIIGGFFGWMIGFAQGKDRDETRSLDEQNAELEAKIYNELLRRKWSRLTARHPRCPLRKFHGSDSNAGTCTDDKAPEAPPAPDP